jgi:adenylate cyclase
MRLGQLEKALEWLEKAYEEHDSGLVSIGVEPMFDSIRSEPRFKEIVRRMKLST